MKCHGSRCENNKTDCCLDCELLGVCNSRELCNAVIKHDVTKKCTVKKNVVDINDEI